MARSSAQKNYFNFTGGLITEASPLTSPDNTSLAGDNFDLKRDGSILRRRGVDYEKGGSLLFTLTHPANAWASQVTSVHEWRSVGGNGSLNNLVVQVGSTIFITSLDTPSISSAGLVPFDSSTLGGGAAATSFDLNLIKSGTADAGISKVQMAFGKGTAFIVGPDIHPIYITYDNNTLSYTAGYIGGTASNILIRDFAGEDDGLALDERPLALTALHDYNLHNQGWSSTQITSYFNGTVGASTGIMSIALGTVTTITVPATTALSNGKSVTIANVAIPGGDPNINGVHVINSVTTTTTTTFTIPVDTSTAVGPYTGGDYHITTSSGTYPSNSDIWWHGKNSTGDFTPSELNKIWFGAIQAPKGHYLFNAFSILRSSKIVGATDQTTTSRPSTIAFYGGRVWYGGIKDSSFGGTILFSRLVEDPLQDAHKCYMDADPTSEIVSDLVASDGGTITIPEAGQIVRLMPIAQGILVFAQNGVWLVAGTNATGGFSATAFSVNKLTNIGTVSPEGVVEVEGNAFYISRSGIYTIAPNPTTGAISANNITQSTIQKKITAISDSALSLVKAVYDPLEREVKWFYSESLNSSYLEAANRAITLDLVLKAFYTSQISGTIGLGVPSISNPFVTLPAAATLPDYESMVRYLTLVPTTATTTEFYISANYDDRLVDWYTSNVAGYDYSSIIDTGYELHKDAMRDKQIDDFHLFFKRTEHTITDGVLDNESACLFSYRFDWADDPSSGQYSTLEEGYYFPRLITIPNAVGTVPFTSGSDVVVTKHSVNGSGRAFQLHIESKPGKDMHLLGWATFISGVVR